MNARLAARAGVVTLLAAAASATAGCGKSDDPKPAGIDVTTPADAEVVHEGTIEVRGLVRPAEARVLVGGRSATVSGGEFHARVPLREGSNLIDVGASAAGAASVWTAVRVSRVVLVTVPDVQGATRDDAVSRIEDLHLRVGVAEAGGLLDELLPGDWRVCEARPRAGTRLRRGGRVQLKVSKTC
jgi:hypothetical protein